VLGAGTRPTFAQFFEYRPTIARFAASAPRAAGWIRPLAPGALRDEAYVIAMADGWWPALFGALSAPRPMATVTFTVDVTGTTSGLAPDAPFYHDARTLSAHDGWAPELRTLWGEDGRLLAVNHQTFVVIK
jgi:hypothetical protein